MTTSVSEPLRISRKKRLLFFLGIVFVCLITFLLLAEVGLRVKGLGPWRIPPAYAAIDPPGAYNVPAPEVGYLSRPGETKITLNSGYTFKMTHLGNGLRITHPLNTYSEKTKQEIWIFGCSFTHGQSLNDSQTYPWLLQEAFPSYEIVNFGVDAYSTVQSWLQFQQALKARPKPLFVILAYGSFHDPRNTLTRSWLKQRLPANPDYVPGSISLPYERFSPANKPELMYMSLDYRGLPFIRYSALANFLDDKYNEQLEASFRSPEISRALIEDFAGACSASGIKFAVAGIYSSPATTKMLEYCNSKGVTAVDISVDLGNRENTNLPYENHPSALANQQYAQKLKSFLCGQLIDEPDCRRP